MGAFFFAVTGSAFLAWLSLNLELIPWRRSAAAHWTIRARQLFPVRVAGGMNAWLIPLLCVLVGWIGWRASWAPLVLGGFIGTTASNYPIDREVRPETSGRAWLHLVVATLVFRILRWATFAAAIFFMPADFNGLAWAITGGFLLVVFSLEFGQGLRVLRWMGLLQAASPRLIRVVEEARTAIGGNVRAAWELATPEANAFAVTTTRELVFTRPLLEAAPDDDLRAICAHELAHLAESRWTMIGRVLGSLAIFPILFYRPVEAKFGLNGVMGLVAMAGAACWLRSRLSHIMEKHADRAAVKSVPHAAAYARGLERIYRLNHMPVVQRKSGLNTHPDLYDRMIAAAVTPDYPRPDPPRTLAWSSTVLVAICVWLVLVVVLK